MKPIATTALITAIITVLSRHVLAQDELSFSGDDGDGCKIIPLGTGGDVRCTSTLEKDVTWWHDRMSVSMFPAQPVRQFNGLLDFSISVTVEDSGDYYCRSFRDKKLLQVHIVNVTENMAKELCNTEPLETSTGANTAISTSADISERTTLGLHTTDPLEAFTSSATAISTPADDLSFSGEDDSGCKIIPLGVGGENTQCLSASDKDVAWWHEDRSVPEYNSGKPVQQLDDRIYFYDYATVDDSGDYYCKSDSDEKLLQVYIVNVTDTTTEDLCATDADTFTGATTDVSTHADISKSTTVDLYTTDPLETFTAISTPADADETLGTSEATNIAVIIVPVIIVALLVALVVFLYFRRRSLSEEVTRSTTETKSVLYDTVALESTTGQCNDSYSPPRKSEHPVAQYEFIDDAIAKSGEYHTLKLDTDPIPSDVDGLYNKLNEVTGKPWTANTNENKANKDDPYAEIKDSTVASQEDNKDSAVEDDDDCARSDEKSNAAGGPVESETDERTNNYFEINLPNTEDLYARPNKPQTSSNQ